MNSSNYPSAQFFASNFSLEIKDISDEMNVLYAEEKKNVLCSSYFQGLVDFVSV